MPDTLETSRLTLRPWSDADVSLLVRLASDPQVVRYIGDGQRWPTERINEVADAVSQHWRRHGFGWRAIVPKGAQQPVGFVMLNYLGEGTARLDPDEFEIGWWLLPAMWRLGLATEAGAAICGEAFGLVRAPGVVARVQPANRASARVAARLGMSHEFDTTGRFGEPVSVYRLIAPELAGRAG